MNAVSKLARRTATWHRGLLVTGCLTLVTAMVSAGGLLFDDRMLTGEPIWLKPFKFSVSIALYAVTWAWMLSLQRRPRRWMSWSASAIALLVNAEMVIIIGQVIRGRASHFNVTTSLDSTLFNIMGAAITTVWVLGMIQGVVLLRERMTDQSVAWAVRFGLVLSSVGIGLAFLMLSPTPDQLDALQHGLPAERVGGHAVGVVDGGPGMPITGWSTVGGDLRIPHFIGIHAMQALPLLAWLLTRLARRLPRLGDAKTRTRLVFVGAGVYAGLMALVTWQALRGQSLIHPDAWTLAALSALAVVAVVGVRAALSGSAGDADPMPAAAQEGAPVR